MAITPQQLVDREVYCNVSALVGAIADSRDTDLAELAYELFHAPPDYEEALIQEGWTETDDEVWTHPEHGTFETEADTLCYELGIEPIEREVFEHWIVSSWLADKLEAQGECIEKDFHGLCIWGRTTTGQAIYMDECIQSLCS